MKGVSGWRDYWSRRRYRRLNERRSRRKMELGGRRFWRMKIRVGPKIRIGGISGRAKKMVLWLRDAYVRMMMGLATSGVRGMSGADAVVGFGRPSVKEYDRNMILHIYNSLFLPPVHRPTPQLPPPRPST
ncbi:uncharacterized protein LOC129306287 [Prosopis cineraria]|uniref:uncharacterized protein LOC129306287 n=1 Tax=Prosopis cineraria TaxID=364024 RepID=UPI00240FA33E|nr:uncharacterized protein LOC129306287 [Prosopis cineraria]